MEICTSNCFIFLFYFSGHFKILIQKSEFTTFIQALVQISSIFLELLIYTCIWEVLQKIKKKFFFLFLWKVTNFQYNTND